MKNLRIALVGLSGSGKTTISEYISEKFEIPLSVSCTTREARPGEVEGKDYYFLTKADFLEKSANGEFMECVPYGDHLYGTLWKDVSDSFVVVLNESGARSFKEHLPDLCTVYVECNIVNRVSRMFSEGESERSIINRLVRDSERLGDVGFEISFDSILDANGTREEMYSLVDNLIELLKEGNE